MASTVVVGCKLPTGLLIDLGEVVEQDGTGRDAQMRVVSEPKQVRLFGSAQAGAVEGFGLTPGVDKDGFEKWLSDNAQYGPVKQGLIFAEPTTDRARDHALMLAGLPNGQEPLDYANPMGDGKIVPDEKSAKPAQTDKK